MSDFSQGPGWWQASDGKWYPPEQQPGPAPPGYGQPPAAAYGYGYATTPVAPRTDGLAVGALVSAIVGVVLMVFCIGIFATAAAIPMGFISRKRIRESGGALTGEGLALAGAIVGIVATTGYLMLIMVVIATSSSN
jgi:hypothetical protein